MGVNGYNFHAKGINNTRLHFYEYLSGRDNLGEYFFGMPFN